MKNLHRPGCSLNHKGLRDSCLGTITDNSQNAKEEKSTNLTKTNKSIKTGDTTNVLLPMFCLTLSVIVILICRKKFYHR